MNEQLKFLKEAMALSYSKQEALDMWNNENSKSLSKVKNGKQSYSQKKSCIILSGWVHLPEFIEYQKTLLDKYFWSDLIESMHLKKLILKSDIGEATELLNKIIEEKDHHAPYKYPIGHPNAGERKLRSQWQQMTDAGWTKLAFNPLNLSNSSDGIYNKTGHFIVSTYLHFVIKDVLLQSIDAAFSDSEIVRLFFQGLQPPLLSVY